MSKDNLKESKEERFNRKKLDADYGKTPICPVCNVRLPISGECDSMLCR